MDYKANNIPRITSNKPPPKAAAPGRLRIPASGNTGAVGVVAIVTVGATVPVAVVVAVTVAVAVAVTVGVAVAVGVGVEVAVAVGVGVTVAVGVGVPVAAATVKLVLQLPPPNHSAARGTLVGAVGTSAF